MHWFSDLSSKWLC